MTSIKFIKLKPSDTFVDHRYQRDIDKKRVEAMAEAFDPGRVGVPVVTKRADGRYAQIDGQHRLAAAVATGLGEAPMLMEVHEEMAVQEEAALFLQLNGGRRAVGAIDKYRARLEALEPTALAIQAILKKFGCRIVKAPAKGGISAVDAVESVYHQGALESVMCVLVTWLDGAPEAFDGVLIRAVGNFLSQVPDAQPLHLAKKLDKYGPSKLRSMLNRESQDVSMSPKEAATYVLAIIYNHGLPKTKKVSWRKKDAA